MKRFVLLLAVAALAIAPGIAFAIDADTVSAVGGGSNASAGGVQSQVLFGSGIQGQGQQSSALGTTTTVDGSKGAAIQGTLHVGGFFGPSLTISGGAAGSGAGITSTSVAAHQGTQGQFGLGFGVQAQTNGSAASAGSGGYSKTSVK